jgi:hypothetical protein
VLRPSLSPFIGGLPTPARLRVANAFGMSARAARSGIFFGSQGRPLLGHRYIDELVETGRDGAGGTSEK